MDANEYTEGVWAGQNPGSGSFTGNTYSQWSFLDGTGLDQCFDKECSSGEGKGQIKVNIMHILMVLMAKTDRNTIYTLNIYLAVTSTSYTSNCAQEVAMTEAKAAAPLTCTNTFG